MATKSGFSVKNKEHFQKNFHKIPSEVKSHTIFLDLELRKLFVRTFCFFEKIVNLVWQEIILKTNLNLNLCSY